MTVIHIKFVLAACLPKGVIAPLRYVQQLPWLENQESCVQPITKKKRCLVERTSMDQTIMAPPTIPFCCTFFDLPLGRPVRLYSISMWFQRIVRLSKQDGFHLFLLALTQTPKKNHLVVPLMAVVP